MSWLKTAVNRAVEVGGRNNLTRTVRNYADSVVQTAGNAVTEGARIFQDRMGARSFNSFRQTAKRLEEVSVSCRGIERVQLLRRWLVALKEIERLSSPYLDLDDNFNSDDPKDSPRKPILVYYVDPDLDGEPMNFRDVFLFSQALEGITLSMILEAPNEEEISLLLEIFGLCLGGGKEIHNAVMTSIQDLATAFSNYQDEVLMKREELLQYAQGAIAGLKINADIPRIDAEACSLMGKLDEMKPIQQLLSAVPNKSSEEKTIASTEDLKEALVQIQMYSKLEELLLKKKILSNGDSPEHHGVKVHKLKIFSESLVNSTTKAEKRILDNRAQKEDALNFRMAKSNEICQLEKDLTVNIQELEKQKAELETALRKVNTSLITTRARLRNAKEEREQFDEASNQILVFFKSKEDELSRSIASCKMEANVVNTWVNFLEDTWVLQTTYNDQKEKQINGVLEKYGDRFMILVNFLLSAYKEQLGFSVTKIRALVDTLHLNKGSEISLLIDNKSSKAVISRKSLEEEYLDLESKFLTTLSIVATMQNLFDNWNEGIYRKDNKKVKELFDALEKIKGEFESINRPILEVENSTPRSGLPPNVESDKNPTSPSQKLSETPEHKPEKTEFASTKAEILLDVKLGMDSLDSEVENSRGSSTEEINDWEFDAFEKDLKTKG
ncbi:coiled-coil domain-containing protein 18 isoform X2 [Melia azedarach]|uniref:Coiled-coil domain-containing protein 18 isoform X2 n=2 Tax=Melia azedarach TaxID=155640 RepID=A0ACC1X0U1_MELAZ|nr:coiled-coil domain-containing protein 18 isoform X2 [Melia azedarach]KAJ4704775.1 coiled-coil domain-containing protein 18 isoform X2 [Melia azedarach]